MDQLARAAIVHALAAMDDTEFSEITAEARGTGRWEPGPEDYRALRAELEAEHTDERKTAATTALRAVINKG